MAGELSWQKDRTKKAQNQEQEQVYREHRLVPNSQKNVAVSVQA